MASGLAGSGVAVGRPDLLFFLAVMASGIYRGTGPGLFAVGFLPFGPLMGASLFIVGFDRAQAGR